MFQLQSSQVVRLTKVLAKEFAEMDPCPRDRAMRESLLSHHRNNLANGNFRPPHWASARCAEDGKVYRVNGKHTSNVIFSSPKEIPNGLKALVERYECETLEDVAKLYGTFDSKYSARSTGDINRVWAAAIPALAALPNRTINLAVTGMAFALWESLNRHKSAEERAVLLTEYPGFVLFLDELYQGDSRHIQRGAVAAAVFVTWRKMQADAKDFWEAVRDGSGTPHNSPDRKLNKLLLSSSVLHASGVNTGKKALVHREMYVKCLHAWNAWRKDADTDMKYFPSAKTPTAV